MMIRILLIAAILFPMEINGQGFWFLAPEFPGGSKTALAGLQDSILFTATNYGIWRSEMAGEANSWQQVLKSGIISCLIATDDGKVLAGGNGKIYFSIDKGSVWDSVTLDHAFPVRQIVRNSKGEYFATTGMMNLEEGFIGNGVMYNDGSLITWHKRNNGLSTSDLFCDYIAIDKNDRLYLATANEYGKDNSGLFMSDDGGITWQHIDIYIDGRGVIIDKITVHFTRALSLIGDSLLVSMEGVAGAVEVRLNLIKHVDDLLLTSKWRRRQVNHGLSWWLDRTLFPVHIAKQGIMYSSIFGSVNVGGSFISEDNGFTWLQQQAGLGLSETGTFNVQYFYETSYGKIFMVQHIDERLYWTDKSIVNPIVISGKVVDQNGQSLSSVLLKAGVVAGNQSSNLTDGSYSFIVPKGWSGNIVPERSNYTFSPEKALMSSIQYDLKDIDFIGVYIGKYYISGRITDVFDSYVTGIEILGFDSPLATNENGFYVAEVNADWDGIITPYHPEYDFQPENIHINDLRLDLSEQNFQARRKGTLTISGIFQDIPGDLRREIELIGLPGNWIIDANGKYTTVVPKYWTGTIVPQLNDYRFMPDTLFINYLQEDLLDQDFTGTLVTSVTEPSNNHIQVYPNPSPDGNFSIRLPKNMKPINIQLFDLAGQKLSEPTFAPYSDATEIRINGKGIYLLKIVTATGFEFFKVSVL